MLTEENVLQKPRAHAQDEPYAVILKMSRDNPEYFGALFTADPRLSINSDHFQMYGGHCPIFPWRLRKAQPSN
jgi:hypothetical protein